MLNLPETVSEEEESGALILLLLLVGEADSAIVVLPLASVQLELVELAGNELDQLGGALLESRNALLLAELGELGHGLLEVATSPGHEVGLTPALNLDEAHLVGDVDNSLTTLIGHLVFILRGDADVIVALGHVLGLSLDASIVKSELVWQGKDNADGRKMKQHE